MDEFELIGDDVKQDGEYPVLPLIYPNNATYNAASGTMSVNKSVPRDKLLIYKPALEFIRSIPSKIATISIVGRARTGKSLIAGELYAPARVPCPFDLGHKMDACTYGVWVSAKSIQHPHDADTVVLVFDVEGTGYHEARKQNDFQLMIVTLLLSSYFIYNSKGAFDAPALDEIGFVTELTDRIQSTPNDDSGEDFSKFFPKFMWLLRDVHLTPVINGQPVSVKEYFCERVLKKQRGMSQQVRDRQWIQTTFLQMFQDYDAFALPMPHSDAEVLQKLGDLSRDELQPAFNQGLKQFCGSVLRQAHNKVLFSKQDDGKDVYIHCRGSHLASWIEQCVESVNDPDQVPYISSMTAAVMSSVFREQKLKAIAEYQQLMQTRLAQLRNGDRHAALDEQEIIELHLEIFNHVLCNSAQSLQPRNNGLLNTEDNDAEETGDDLNGQQFAVFSEFCEEIGHSSDVTKIGKTGGIMCSLLSENRELSLVYCRAYLHGKYEQIIEPMLQQPQTHSAEAVISQFGKLETAFHQHCKGPAKEECWAEFKSNTMRQSVEQFRKLKGFNEKLLRQEAAAAEQRELHRVMQSELEKQKFEAQQQQQLMKDEVSRIEVGRQQEQADHVKALQEAEERMRNMQQSQFTELAKSFQESNASMNQQMMKMQEKNANDTKEMMQMMHESIVAMNNRPIPEPQVVHVGGGPDCIIL